MHPLLLDFGSWTIGGMEIPLRIPAYGTFMLLGMLAGWMVVRKLGPRVDPDLDWSDLFLGLLISGILGAKVLHLIVEIPELRAGQVTFWQVFMSGGIWLGAVLFGLAYAWSFFRRHPGLNAGAVLNVMFTAVPLGHIFGRLGCFFAGCCYGGRCDLPWAVTYTNQLAARFSGTPLGVGLHPTPLYEVTAEAFNFTVCLLLWKRRPAPGLIVVTWMGLYGAQRFFIEFLRGDPRGGWWLLSTSQWISVTMVVGALVWLMSRRGALFEQAPAAEPSRG